MTTDTPETTSSFPIVAVCASAGGLAAYQAFFSGLQPGKDPGMAFVLVQHLDPVHKSLLAELIRGFATLEVDEVTEGLVVVPNRIYVLPRGQEMTIDAGVLHLADPPPRSTLRLPINLFLESLAQDRGPSSASVILSGTGTDGTVGSQTLRKLGGFVVAQSLESAEYTGMPLSVVATGQVNAILAPQEMVPALVAHFKRRRKNPKVEDFPISEPDQASLQSVLSILKAQTTHDFSQYKPTTVKRRIERRMTVHRLDTMSAYRELLERDAREVMELFNDILIGVTRFFRDPEVFDILEKRIIPKLVADHPRETKIRVWSVGCSTGEEAYSLAILLRQSIEAQTLDQSIEVFATDLDKRAINVARAGLYPSSSAEALTPDRFHRFFVPGPAPETFRVTKAIRNTVVFSEHNVLKDPPFSKLDLLACRNLLIYFSLELQKKLLPLFHYALNPGGILVLGTAETIGEFGHLFQPLDRGGKIYVRRETSSVTPRHWSPPFLAVPALPMTDRSPAIPVEKGSNSGLSLKEVAEETILTALEMAAALVDEQGKIFYLHGRTGYFLEPTPGVVSSQNILKMAKPGLKHPIATALHQARIQEAVIHHREIQVQWEDLVTVVQVSVHPLKRHSSAGGQPLFLVLLEKRPARRPAHTSDVPDAGRLEELRDELKTQEEYLQSTTEQMESSNEELSASNEELQSVNEELQSTNEELDTSKEELQSVNEELSTVNSELTSKVSLLTTTLNDMTNLLAATGVATVFVDLHMNILRFTPEATRIINLVPSDVGRPVGHLTSNLLNYKTLEQDTQGVLDTLVRFEAEIQTRQNAWYRLRIQPYRTLDNIIEGAVISFGDITEIVLQRQTLQSTNELLRLASVVQNSRDPIVVQDLEGRVLAWNPAAVALYGWTEEEALAANFRDHIPKELQSQTLQKMRDLVLSDSLETYQSKRLTKDGRALEVSVTSNALVTSERKIYAVSTLERVKTTKAPE